MTSSNEILRHEPERRRFVLLTDAHTALLEYDQPTPTTLDYRRTFVPSELRGRGVASRLAAFALEHALEQGLRVIPTCPFVAAYIERHPRFRAIVAE